MGGVAAGALREGGSVMTYYGNKELARSFRTVRANTLAVAEDIPEPSYGFRPAPETRSVAEILKHVVFSARGAYDAHAVRKINTYVGVDFRALARERQQQEQQVMTKPEILDALRRDGEAWAKYLDSVPETELADLIPFPEGAEPPVKSRFEMLLSAKEHEMHHRAQLMVIERLLGILPHLTRRRMEYAARAAAPKPAGS
jgi:uncharacterized damage-inducible protein DinB